ncbi:hypothetical protein ACE939_12185 [Aquimarina sp. W85]|uniref:hypothetical protein n=1 Tax=Aquimarina rhodophyticola TaxID=3342246 RepID=UPI0036702B48
MKNFYTLLLLILLAGISCSKDDSGNSESNPENPKTGVEIKNDSIIFFTLNVDKYWQENGFYKSGYIIINDEDGKLIDYRKIKNDSQYVFKAKKTEVLDRFTVTRFVNGGSNSINVNIADSYHNIEKDAVWNLGGVATNSDSGNQANVVLFDLRVDNISGWTDYTLSDNKGHLTYARSEDLSSLDFSGILMVENDISMLTIHFESQPSKYIFLERIRDGDLLTISGNDLIPFDSSIQVNLPENGYIYTKNLRADHRNGSTFITNSNVEIKPKISDKLELLDAFSNYTISIQTSDSEKNLSYSYNYSTLAPKNINVPTLNSEFMLINSNFRAFKFETNQEYDTKISVWRNDLNSSLNSINILTFNSNEQDFSGMPEYPTELFTSYPEFELETLEYERTSLTKGWTPYTDFFKNKIIEDDNLDTTSEVFRFSNPALKNNKSSINDLKIDSFLKDQEINW